MSGVLSKRQQARNEKLLQDLVHSVPGNNRCADCHMPNPAWASWSLGVFLCLRCAAIHRKLGTHISKVKSLSMDSWSNEQVDNMQKVGNVKSNHIYNPGNKRPSVPVDADEADSAMERFIRQKYMNNVAGASDKPRVPRADEGTPPPLPPKNSTKFGFRSASSIFPLSSRAKKEAKAVAVAGARSKTSPVLMNKPSKVFGATVDLDGPDDVEKKLAKLRDMGFQDSQRNAIVLRGVNGSLERAVEALVRLGEGDSPFPALTASPRENTLRISRSLTPLTSKHGSSGIGLGVPQKSAQERPTTASTTSTKQIDVAWTAQPQTAQSTGSLQNKNPYNSSKNPFWQPAQQLDAVNQSFQGLTVSAPQQSLFPHRTGDLAAPMPRQQPMYHQTMSPSAPPSPSYYQPISFQNNMTCPQWMQQPQQVLQTSCNPFFSQPSSPIQSRGLQQNLSFGTSSMQGNFANNPFARPPARIASPALGQIPEQGQSTFLCASPQPLATNMNPFFASQAQTPAQQMGQHPYSQEPFGQQAYDQQPLGQQQRQNQPQRADKASIMALYDGPHGAPPTPLAPKQSLPTQTPRIAENLAVYSQLSQPSSAMEQPRSIPQPLAGSTNPFVNHGAAPGSDSFASRHKVGRQGMTLGLDMAWTNGRHSPDAFASLSARHV